MRGCSCCHPGAEQPHEEVPGPPANPPKQHRARGKSESQPQDNGTQPSGKAAAGSGIAAAGSAPDLAQEVTCHALCLLQVDLAFDICTLQAGSRLHQDIC